MNSSENKSASFRLLLTLGFLAFFSYAIVIPWLGFYYDDWPFAWISHRLGPLEFIDSFKPFRPFLGPYFVISASIFGEFPWVWHVFNLVVRISLSIGCYWALKQVWPNKNTKIFWIAVFFLLYPGFNQQWISMTHSNQGLIPHLFQILSIGLMAKSLRSSQKTRSFSAFSIAATFIGVFSTEYFLSLELLRPLFIWVILDQTETNFQKRLNQTFKKWGPYLAIMLLNVIWLIYYQSSGMYDSYKVSIIGQLIANPVGFLQTNISEFITSFSLSAFEVWFGLFNQFKNPLNAVSTFLGFGISAFTFIFLYFFIVRFKEPISVQSKSDNERKSDQNWAVQPLLIGGIGVLLGKLPSWGVGLPLSNEFPHDRLMMSVMLSASIFFVGFIEWLVGSGMRKSILYILIASLAVGHHFTIGNTYRRDWEQQKDFFQQLVWRAPNLEEGTILLTHELPHKYVTDNSLSAALNWVYDPDNRSRDISYMLVYSKARLGSALLPELAPGSTINYLYRTMNFSSTTDQTLVIYYPTGDCLRILDPLYTNIEFFPEAPYMLTDAIFLSDLSLINPNEEPASTLPSFFGRVDQSNWCYFFQKAELARQSSSWEEIVAIYKNTFHADLQAKNPTEYLVFAEALIRTGNFDTASALVEGKLVTGGGPVNGTCYTLKRIADSMDWQNQQTVFSIAQSINCELFPDLPK